MASSLASFYLLGSSTVTGGIARFLGPFGGGYGESTAELQLEMPFAATLRNFRVFASAGFGTGGPTVWTVRVNGVDTALTTTINANASPYAGADSTHSVAVSAGDKVAIKYVHTIGVTSTASAHLTASLEVVTTTGLRDILHFCPDGSSPSTAARFGVEFAGGLAALTTESFLVVPVAGTLRNLRVTARTAPTGANNITYTARLNLADSALTCTVAQSAAPHAGQDLVNAISVAAHDRIGLKVQHSGLPSTNGADFMTSMEFEQ